MFCLLPTHKSGVLRHMAALKSTAFTGLRVLVVEDEYFLANDVKRLLLAQDASVTGPFASANSARAAMQDKQIDLAILDINLGDHDVLSLAAEFDLQKLPYLFMTGYSRGSVPEEFSHVSLVRKPCEDGELLDAILALGLRPSTSQEAAPGGSPTPPAIGAA